MIATTAIVHRDVKPANVIHASPVLKWPGGKRNLLHELLRRLPPLAPGALYFEPFAGGAALFFALAPANAVLGDANADLIALYRALVEDVETVIDHLERHTRLHGEPHFGRVRQRWNTEPSADWFRAERAAAMLYLNRACFNGLWRVNAAGAFNVGWSKRAEVRFDLANLRAAAALLARAELRAGDYRATLADARPGDLVYVDSPYDGTWTGYTSGAFGPADQRELAETVRALAGAGVNVIASNAATARVRELYAGLRIDSVRMPRAINSDPDGRGDVDELLVLAGPAFAPTTCNPRPERTHATMTTATQTTITPLIDETIEDVIERGIRRTLPVKLTDPEFTEIAKRRAVVEQERDGMKLDLDREKKRRQQLIEEREADIEKMGRELRTGEQDRTVPCTKVFRRELDGSGWVVLLRNDTGAEVTREPASPAVLQRHLPHVDSATAGRPRSVLDEAADAQAREARGDDESEADEDDGLDDAPPEDDDSLGIETELVDVGPQDLGELPAKPKRGGRGKKAGGRGKGKA